MPEINNHQESPDYVKTSLAAAMTLGFKAGLFYRDARLFCINLLLTYSNGCSARCAYCGLSGSRPGNYNDKSFIRVQWPKYALSEIITRIVERKDRVHRVCISMITHQRAAADTRSICRQLRSEMDIPISILVAPTLIEKDDLLDFKACGADKVGIAIDLATPRLFDRYRGRGVGGPHKWEKYWQCLTDALEVFGPGNFGPHFMVGMGETEKEMAAAIQRAKDMGGTTHLFSFYPEAKSSMSDHSPPPMDHYRRIQIARYIIDAGLSSEDRFVYDTGDRIDSFGMKSGDLDAIIDSGQPFRTSGCTGKNGEVACNRPFGNSPPGPNIRNFPFAPEREDIQRIRTQMKSI